MCCSVKELFVSQAIVGYFGSVVDFDQRKIYIVIIIIKCDDRLSKIGLVHLAELVGRTTRKDCARVDCCGGVPFFLTIPLFSRPSFLALVRL